MFKLSDRVQPPALPSQTAIANAVPIGNEVTASERVFALFRGSGNKFAVARAQLLAKVGMAQATKVFDSLLGKLTVFKTTARGKQLSRRPGAENRDQQHRANLALDMIANGEDAAPFVARHSLNKPIFRLPAATVSTPAKTTSAQPAPAPAPATPLAPAAATPPLTGMAKVIAALEAQQRKNPLK